MAETPTRNVLFAAGDARWPQYRAPLKAAFDDAGLNVDLSQNHAPEDTDYIIFAPGETITDFSPYARARVVMGLWAGVETIVTNDTLTQPLTRMVDAGLEGGMVEWVAAHVLRHHVGMDAHILGQDGNWRNGVIPPLAHERAVTVLGLGALGAASATMLARIGFRVTGWSRSQKDIAGVRCLSGEAGLAEALSGAEILVLLLPQTAETLNLMDAARIALLAPDAVIINPGRGPLIDDTALLAALDTGRISHATLDVFRIEPLPADHPYWHHPRVTVTPHIASETRPSSAAKVIAENIRRCEAGEPLLFLVDRDMGY